MKDASACLPSKARYEILDGLRGVAALMVLAYHLFEIQSDGIPAHIPLNHGYLAVDFFFILSGFVTGYAYDDRWGGMSLWDFCKRRLVRLHPMIVFATLLGVALFYFGRGDYFPLISSTPVEMLLLCALLSVLMVPAPVGMDIRGWGEVNAINGNAWTLYFEYFANLLYALVVRRFPKWLLVVCVLLSALLTLNLALDWDLTETLNGRELQQYTMIGGWSLTAQEMLVGFTRLLFPFLAGLLLSRLGWLVRVKAGFWWCSLLLAAVLAMPRIGGEAHGLWNGVYEAACVLLLFPLLVSLGAGSTVSGQSARVCQFLGDISYPLYIIHYPIITTLFGAWRNANPDLGRAEAILVSMGLYVLCVFLAYASLRLYDVPVRGWLRKHWLARRP